MAELRELKETVLPGPFANELPREDKALVLGETELKRLGDGDGETVVAETALSDGSPYPFAGKDVALRVVLELAIEGLPGVGD